MATWKKLLTLYNLCISVRRKHFLRSEKQNWRHLWAIICLSLYNLVWYKFIKLTSLGCCALKLLSFNSKNINLRIDRQHYVLILSIVRHHACLMFLVLLCFRFKQSFSKKSRRRSMNELPKICLFTECTSSPAIDLLGT